MIKKFAAVSAIVLTMSLTTCSVSTAGAVQLNTQKESKSFVETIKDLKQKQDLEQKQFAKMALLRGNTQSVNKMLKSVKKRIGKTWYVFSGNTPSGWDCSGLVMWAYGNIGINLEHSASVQKNSGKKVKTPKPGDIVAFGWKNFSGAQHVGIYIGDGKMIHSGGGPGESTQIVNIKKWAGTAYSKITYTRMLDTI